MREFAFPSAGICVVYRGDDLFLTQKLLAEFEDKYVGRVSERVLHGMLVIAQNVEAIRAAAQVKGDEATFGTWTFNLATEELAHRVREVSRESALFRRKLVRLTGTCLTWVIEWGKRGGRIHGHYAADGWQSLELIEKAKQVGQGFVGRCNIKRLGAGGYMWKEMGKGVGRRGLGVKLMGSHGDFKGRSVMRDFVIDSPMAECRRLAWRERRRAEPYRLTWERGREIYQKWLRGEESLGREYDRFRESCGGRDWRDADFKLVGDAYEGEDQSKDAGFNAEDFEQ
jgi:hypothetical protein